jgi:hypothetical protein
VISIATPCHVDWATMSGTGAVRHCGSCRKQVYNLSEMAEAEAEALLAAGEELCVRYYYRPDGTIVTSRCEPARRSTGSPARAGMAAALATSAAFAGITTAVEPAERTAEVSDQRVLVAMGGLRLKIKQPDGQPVSDVPSDPVWDEPYEEDPPREPLPEVPPEPMPARVPLDCADPWDCPPSEPAPAVISAEARSDIELQSSRRGVVGGILAGLAAGLVALIALTRAAIRRGSRTFDR